MSLLLWLPLNGNLDNQGLTNASVTNNGATVNTSGKIGQCYSFDGTDDYISIPVDVAKSITGPFSAAFWLKVLSWNKAYQTVFGICGTSAAWAQELACFQRSNQQNSFIFTFANGTDNLAARLYTGTINLNEWYHFTCVYDGSKAYIYQNGENVKDYTPTFTPDLTIAQSFNLGRAHTGYQCNMLLNDFRLYDHALSPLEIKEISKGLVLHYPLSNEGCENVIKNSRLSANFTTWTSTANGIATPEFITKDGYECLHIIGTLQKYRKFTPYFTVKNDSRYLGVPQPGDKYTLSMDVLFENVVKGTTNYLISFHANGETIDGTWRAPDGIKNSGHMLSDTGDNLDPNKLNGKGWVRTWRSIEFGDYNWSKNWSFQIYFRDFTGDVYIKNAKVEVGDVVTPWTPNPADAEYSALGYDTDVVYDCSGLQNNGTTIGSLSYVADSPRYYTAPYFNGSSYIYTAAGTWNWFDYSQCTISVWLKPTTSPSGHSGSVGVSHDGTNAQKCFAITNMRGKFCVYYNDGSYTNVDSGYTLPLNEWHLCTAVLDGTTVKLYVDGVLKKTQTITWNDTVISTVQRVQVGVDLPGSNEIYTGYYSDVRIYTTALSDSDILALYQKSALVASNGTLMAYEYSEV